MLNLWILKAWYNASVCKLMALNTFSSYQKLAWFDRSWHFIQQLNQLQACLPSCTYGWVACTCYLKNWSTTDRSTLFQAFFFFETTLYRCLPLGVSYFDIRLKLWIVSIVLKPFLFICVEFLLSAGLYGKLETKFALMGKRSIIPSRLYVMHVV